MKDLIITGPCGLESLHQIEQVAKVCLEHNNPYIRTHLFKPRTSPYSFQGLGVEGINIVQKVREYGLKTVSEVCSVEQYNICKKVIDVFQIGARNMQNFELLKDLGKLLGKEYPEKQIILKRAMAATLDEFMCSAEYLIQGGIKKENIILCERGTRSHASPTGIALDMLIPLELKKHDFKVIMDVSHGTKKRDYVLPVAKTLMHMPVDGILIEAHPVPERSVSDAHQAISLEELSEFFEYIKAFRDIDIKHPTVKDESWKVFPNIIQ